MIAGKASPSTAEPTLRGRELFGGLFDHAQGSRVATQSEAGIGGYDYTEEIDGLVQEERVADDEIGFRRLVRAAVEPSPSAELSTVSLSSAPRALAWARRARRVAEDTAGGERGWRS